MSKSIRRTVKEIIDGDTIKVARKIGDTNKVRLSGVNAPERRTHSGRKATNILRSLIGGKTVTVRPEGRSYDRVVCTIIHNRKNINKKMKERGY